jgi:hypothetical protein
LQDSGRKIPSRSPKRQNLLEKRSIIAEMEQGVNRAVSGNLVP